MNNEKKLLSKAILGRDIVPLLMRNVNLNWFGDDDDKRVWTFVRDHYSKYGECPTQDVIHNNYPTYVILDNVYDSLDYLIDSVVEQRRKISTVNMIREAVNSIDKDQNHEDALLKLQRGLIRLEDDGLSGSTDIDLTKDPLRRWDDYLERKDLPNGLRGIPTGFPTIDQATSGLQNGQLVVIIAPPKTGKSTLALQVALNLHREHGKVPMFQSFEMSNIEQENRYDAMRSLISHHRLLTGTLTQDEEARYKKILEGLEKIDHKFWLVDSAAGSTVSGIASKIQTLQPDIVFIDGVYLMIDEQSGEANTPQALTNITRSLKRLAQRFNKPIVITTQVLTWKMKKGNVTADSIGYSSSFFQDADIILGLQREDENVDDTRLLKVVASRNSGPAEVTLEWQWNEGRFREMDAGDL
jgi:replicative DNA helicase